MKKRMRLFAPMTAIVLLLLTSCTPNRVLTELPEGEIVERVELRDGYLRFIDGAYLRSSEVSLNAEDVELPYEVVAADLEFDPVEMSMTLPEKYHLTEGSLEPIIKELSPPHRMPFGGYVFSRKGDPGEYTAGRHTVYPEFRIILKRVTEEEQTVKHLYKPIHRGYPKFGTLPWETRGLNGKYRAEWRSEIGAYEVGVMHDLQNSSVYFPGVEWDYFYGGFYAGDLAVSIESDYGYCTQAEFIEVFLAIFDYITALEA